MIDWGSGRIPPPCPNCGKPEGAVMGKTGYGHAESVCSDRCGHALTWNPRWALERAGEHRARRLAEAREERMALRDAERMRRLAERGIVDVCVSVAMARAEEDEAAFMVRRVESGSESALQRRLLGRDCVSAQAHERKAAEHWLEAVTTLLGAIVGGR